MELMDGVEEAGNGQLPNTGKEQVVGHKYLPKAATAGRTCNKVRLQQSS